MLRAFAVSWVSAGCNRYALEALRGSHGYAEMRATIDGAIRQLGITTTLISLAAIMLGLVIWLPEDNTVTPFLFALSFLLLRKYNQTYF